MSEIYPEAPGEAAQLPPWCSPDRSQPVNRVRRIIRDLRRWWRGPDQAPVIDW